MSFPLYSRKLTERWEGNRSKDFYGTQGLIKKYPNSAFQFVQFNPKFCGSNPNSVCVSVRVPVQTNRTRIPIQRRTKCQDSKQWFKGIMSPVEYLLRTYKLKSVLSWHAKIVLIFSLLSSGEKSIWSFCLLLWKHLLILKVDPKAASNVSSRFHFALIGQFFSSVHLKPAFGKKISNHRRVSEQLLKAHEAIRKPKQALWSGLLEGISQLVSDFIEASRNCILDLLHKKTTENCENHKRSFKKFCFDF